MNTDKHWTPDEDAILTMRCSEGMPSSEIARLLGRTMRSVTGRRFRLKLAQRNGKPPRQKPKPAPSLPQPAMLLIPIHSLNNTTCRWPIGDRPPFKFCGLIPRDGSSYCEGHAEASVGFITKGKTSEPFLPFQRKRRV